MHADQLMGKWMEFKGELKTHWRRFTDEDLQEIEGNHEKFIGKVHERYRDTKEEVLNWADEWHNHPKRRKEHQTH